MRWNGERGGGEGRGRGGEEERGGERGEGRWNGERGGGEEKRREERDGMRREEE